MRTIRMTLVALGMAIGLGLLAGCGGGGSAAREIKGAKIGGVVQKSGAAIKLLKDEEIGVSFSQKGATAVGATGNVKEDGTFTIDGPTNQGIPPGTYQVQISSSIYGGDGTNRFENIFTETAPASVEVTSEEGQQFVVDVGSKTVKKKK